MMKITFLFALGTYVSLGVFSDRLAGLLDLSWGSPGSVLRDNILPRNIVYHNIIYTHISHYNVIVSTVK